MVARLVKVALGTSLLQLGDSSLTPFESFIEEHARTYQQGTSEFEERRYLYETRLANAERHNSNPDRLYSKGVNKLWDWTDSELKTLRGWDGSKMPAGGSTMRSARQHSAFLQQDSLADVPTEKIWDNLVMSKNIKNQANCGSCWAIASASTLEAHAEIYSGKPRSFSAQQIVMCTPNPKHCGGDGGCQGATAELAMAWVLKNGLAEESAVPYTGRDGACTMGSATADMASFLADDSSESKGAAAFGMTGWETLPKNEYAPLVQALANRGPVAVSVAADTWFDYSTGIFNGCGKDSVIDHAVVAIGYGEENGKKFWLIQNSWGRSWGELGHIRLERHEDGDYCGTNSDPQKGVACKGETAAVPVCGMCGVLFDSVVPHFVSAGAM